MPRFLTPFTARRLIAAWIAAVLAASSSAGVSLARPTAAHSSTHRACAPHRCRTRRHHRGHAHVRVTHRGHRRRSAHRRATARRHRRTPVKRTVPTTKTKTIAPVTTTAPAAPVTKAPAAPVTKAPAAPVIKTTPAAPVTTTTSPSPVTTSPVADQVLFDPAYPSSGDSPSVPSTGWHTAQVPSLDGVPQTSRIQFTPAPGSATDPNFPTINVLRFQLNPYSTVPGAANGDVTDTGGYLANRAEIYGRYGARNMPAANWPDPVGSTRWYSFSIYLPVGFPTATSHKNWFDFTQWKGLNSGSPPVAMSIVGNQFVLGGKNSDRTLGPITPGSWTHFIVGLNFSDTAATGWATVYLNGNLVVDQAPTKTMNDATVNGITGVDPNYLKMGIYRSTTWQTTQVIYLTPMVIGTTYDSVATQ